MHPIFSISLFTGQQLILEAIQRWLARPCTDAESQRQRRMGLKGLLSLLVKTTATGVLATVLDAAIEFRRRQLLAAAAADPEDGAFGGPSSFPGLGMLSRAGITSWKSRLLLGIDELERRAEAYGIESRRRFSPSKLSDNHSEPGVGGKAALQRHASSQELDDAERSERLGRTVAQLQNLVKKADTETQQRRSSMDDEVGSLLDLLLGTSSSLPPPPPRSAAAAAASSSSSSSAACRSRSVPAALNCMDGGREAGVGMRACHSRASLEEPGSPEGSGGSQQTCQICMDSHTNVEVAGCRHDLCFGCARRLCATDDHSVPQCPFCRQPIDGFIGRSSRRTAGDWSAGAGNSTALVGV